ncbi:MAG: hypothetical protein WDN23_21420 [Edaphobacter sp.]
MTTTNKAATTIGAKAPIDENAVKVPPVQPAHAYLTATVNRIPLRTIMDVTAPENYGDLGVRYSGKRAGEGGVGRPGEDHRRDSGSGR